MLQKDVTPARAKASLFFFFAYEAIFATGWLAIPWLYPSEFMPLRHRTQSASIATAADWIFNYMIVQITPISISNIRWKTYMIFFVLNLLLAITIWLFYPETSGRTLEEIDYIFMGGCDKVLVIGKNGRTLPGFRSMMKRQDPERLGGITTRLHARLVPHEAVIQSDKTAGIQGQGVNELKWPNELSERGKTFWKKSYPDCCKPRTNILI